ncbi:hypothetical protein RB195_002559 [Necator americanus]|uniref:Selenium binding protein n=1 Tax=Necator americanus TaxID=51031 RepID=A0ABR1DJL8_NECAM
MVSALTLNSAKVVLGGLLGGISEAFVKSPLLFQIGQPREFGFPEMGKSTPRTPRVATTIRGTNFRGGPAFLQLSVDGKRLYVGNSFYKQWDSQFYPELIANGGQIARIDIGGGGRMSLSDSFLIDLKDMEGGPYLARDLRFFNGDSTSDNFL